MASVNSEQISELTHRDQDEEDSTLSLSSNGGSNLPPKKRVKVKKPAVAEEESEGPPPLVNHPTQAPTPSDVNNLLSLGGGGQGHTNHAPPQYHPGLGGYNYNNAFGNGMPQLSPPPNGMPQLSPPPGLGLQMPMSMSIPTQGSHNGMPTLSPSMFHHPPQPQMAAVARASVPMAQYYGQQYLTQVVSTDQTDVAATAPIVQGGKKQQSKRWVRWSDHEDQILRLAVEQSGDNNWKFISDNVFNGSRSESQCKNRWKKALQPGLVKGHWTKEEDDRIVAFAVNGEVDEKGEKNWAALRLPGRVGEQVKARWENILDPTIKKGVWTEDEMKLLRDGQKELGNKWAEIAKRIPGRNESSVKNRWYNVKTQEKKAKKKAEQALRESLEQELAAAGGDQKPAAKQEESDISEV